MSDDTLRIEYMPLSELIRHPRNPKDHDTGAIANSISRFGYVSPILIDERTGWIIAGHGRLDTLVDMQKQQLDAPNRIQVKDNEWHVPVMRGLSFNSDAEVDAYLVADNRLTELGGWNNDDLVAILQDLAHEDMALMEATGYDGDDLDDLLNMNYEFDVEAAWQGMPEFEQDTLHNFHSMIIHFKTEDDLIAFAKLVEQTITTNTKYIYYPKLERTEVQKYRVVSNES